MKKAVSLLLSLPVIIQAGGMVLILLLLQTTAKNKIHKVLNSTETRFEKLSLTHDEFRLAKVDESELMFEGKMFDIKSITIHEKFVEVIAYHDKKEEDLISSIKNFLGTKEENKGSFPAQFQKLLTAVYTLPNNSFLFSQTVSQSALLLTISDFYFLFPGDVFSPPPEHIA